MKAKLLLLILTFELLNGIVEAKRISLKPKQRHHNETIDKMQFMHSLMGHMSEPVCLLKGEKRNIAFIVPNFYLNERFQHVKLMDRSGVTGDVQEVVVKPIKPPDVCVTMKLSRDENFSTFLPSHQKMASELIEVLMRMNDTEEFLSAAVFCREKINPYLFIYALQVVMLHRQDTRNVTLPTAVEIFPDKYLVGRIFPKARQEANSVPEGARIPIEIPRDYTASDLEPEHRISYFREDIGMNLNHWYWHLIYPVRGSRKIVDKDRRGELFFYFHHQILARNNDRKASSHHGVKSKQNTLLDPATQTRNLLTPAT